jgi:hypothetical protein
MTPRRVAAVCRSLSLERLQAHVDQPLQRIGCSATNSITEAIELLRECRGRRPEGGPLGYLPDEPLIALSSRDPANLYTTSLEILREDGEILPRHQKGGNNC